MPDDSSDDTYLILAAEECPQDQFNDYHVFTKYENSIVSKLVAHGPVLLRGGRGSGKSALLIESYLQMKERFHGSILPIYISLRHLPLLKTDGAEYLSNFCQILSRQINSETNKQYNIFFPVSRDVGSLLSSLEAYAIDKNQRVVLLFDDAAHIGRERPLEEFFDVFRTISTSRISCKASIYPGVTKFGLRFDVFNDATVIDISRDERRDNFHEIFAEILNKRFPSIVRKVRASRRIDETSFSQIMGRAVSGNLRSFVFACNNIDENDSVGFPEITKCLVDLSSNYFWPLLEEVAPKLGSYEALVSAAEDIAQSIFNSCATRKTSYCIVHRDIMQRASKIFEILEYAGFIARRDASKAMKSGGRGVLFSMNLCNLLDVTPGKRLTSELADQWMRSFDDPYELHSSNVDFKKIEIPEPTPGSGLSILEKDVSTLRKSNIYPYGLTDDKISRLMDAGIETIIDIFEASDKTILDIPYIGNKHLERIRAVANQAVWM